MPHGWWNREQVARDKFCRWVGEYGTMPGARLTLTDEETAERWLPRTRDGGLHLAGRLGLAAPLGVVRLTGQTSELRALFLSGSLQLDQLIGDLDHGTNPERPAARTDDRT